MLRFCRTLAFLTVTMSSPLLAQSPVITALSAGWPGNAGLIPGVVAVVHYTAVGPPFRFASDSVLVGGRSLDYAPVIGSILPASGPTNPFSCGNLRAPVSGGTVTALAYGLGATTGASRRTSSATVGKPGIMVDGKPLEVLESVSLLGQYRVTFNAPAGDGLHEAVLSIGDRQSRAIGLPADYSFSSVRGHQIQSPGAQCFDNPRC